MNAKFKPVKGIIFDYGGTLDTNGRHWAEVLWEAYKSIGIPVAKEQFREAYIHAERTLATRPLIEPHHIFYDVLYIKAGIQVEYLIENGILAHGTESSKYAEQIATQCNQFVEGVVKKSYSLVKTLANCYNLVVVSNFYGNIHTVLKNYGLLCSFQEVIESSVVGIRKPDPAIFTLGVKALGLLPEETVVIGDSYSKDILPARQAGCHTIWLKGEGWDNEGDDSVPDAVIQDIGQVADLLIGITNK